MDLLLLETKFKSPVPRKIAKRSNKKKEEKKVLYAFYADFADTKYQPIYIQDILT